MMKKVLAILMAAVMMLSLCACSATLDKKAEEAFTNTDLAYDLTNTFSHDIYEAWYMGIHESDEIKGKYGYYTTNYDYSDGYTYFCNQLSIEEKHISAALEELTGEKGWKGYELLLGSSTSLFSSCVNLVTEAYDISGKTAEIGTYVDTAKEAVRSISKTDPDYAHYEDLKYYLAETAAFYEFCCNPEGSFDQVVETFNAYRNDARKYYNVLALFFEDVNKEAGEQTDDGTMPV